MTTVRCLISQESADLNYLTAEDLNHTWRNISKFIYIAMLYSDLADLTCFMSTETQWKHNHDCL